VIDECWVKIGVEVKQKKAGLHFMTNEQRSKHQMQPKVILNGSSSDLRINLSHSIFNKLANLGGIFDMS
jgi:hypothetical protein